MLRIYIEECRLSSIELNWSTGGREVPEPGAHTKVIGGVHVNPLAVEINRVENMQRFLRQKLVETRNGGGSKIIFGFDLHEHETRGDALAP